ncbi:interleukin-5 receptor subunit alpha-like [Acipenser oxyrinchus oxyrinchus]|uniref:Interleukin-5 receptor subunit alpha-like n=1 Tax=Acipenser oxyrinchus oxyrinchus TaxID=40147 RepID=A0AAD8G8U0_ACIOX|nr:interleukin-5 receptor subunit alpha-like [Acipenser oxyrinchus oxyrinchus]
MKTKAKSIMIHLLLFVCFTSLANLSYQSNHSRTSAKDLQCIFYNVTYLNCTFHMEVLEETQYFLFFSRKKHTEECPNYTQDMQKSKTVCHFPSLNFPNYKDFPEFTIYVNGTSKQTVIQPLSQEFYRFEIEKLNPPLHVSVADDLRLKWEQPPFSFQIAPICFIYELCIDDLHLKIKTQIENINTPYTLSNLDLSRRYTLQLRVKGGGSCGFNESLWSDWTEAIYVGSEKENVSNNLILALVTVLLIMIIFLVCICRRYKLLFRLYPPIPHPKIKIDEASLKWIQAQGHTSNSNGY